MDGRTVVRLRPLVGGSGGWVCPIGIYAYIQNVVKQLGERTHRSRSDDSPAAD